jgi:hypothetical protein
MDGFAAIFQGKWLLHTGRRKDIREEFNTHFVHMRTQAT